MSNPAIRVENLSKRYFISHQKGARDGLRHSLEEAFRNPLRWVKERNRQKRDAREEFWALNGVSFEIKQGEVVGIIGRNGAGKSTLLKILSRITEPTSGRITINGRVASLLEVGTGFHPELTGRENIFLNGAILGMSRAEIKAKFDEIVAFSEVETFLDTPVKRYSSGMYVRLAFAVAAHLEPEILIVDEVLAVGDAQFQKKCLGKMNEVAKGGRTVLFVSHNMAAVLNLCQRCLLMEKGRLKMLGESAAVVSTFLNEQKEDNRFSRANAPHEDTKVVVENLEVRPQPIQTGAPFECLVHVSRLPTSTGALVAHISVDFISDRETRLLQLYSHNAGEEFTIPPGKSVYCVALERLPLVPGRYSLVAWLGYGQITFDLVWDCYSLTVDPGFYNEGFYIENRGVPVVAECSWSRSELPCRLLTSAQER